MAHKCMVALSLLSVLLWADGAQDPKAVISNASKAPASRMQRIRTQAENPPHGGRQQFWSIIRPTIARCR
jgi:hypothetical protein